MADAATHPTESTRLQRLLSPKSIAVIGASNKMPSIGGFVMANIARVFDGAIYPVNPREKEVQGHPAFAGIDALPRDIDLAMVVVPAEMVPTTLEACAAQGVAGVVIITSGFAEVGGAGIPLQEKIAEIIKRTGIRATGPNCIGFMNIAERVMANFVVDPKDELPKGGPVALVSQSGGFGGYMVRKALFSGLNVGWFFSTGNEVDINIAQVMRALVERDEVKVLLAFAETLRDPDVFIDTALRAAQLDKPLIVLKAGRSNAAARAAQAHTGSLVGSAEAFDALCRQYGVFSVSTLEEILDLGLIFQGGRRAKGRRAGLITGSGGAGVLLTDSCVLEGLSVPELPQAEQDALLPFMPKPFLGSVANPIDVTAQALRSPESMRKVMLAIAASPSIDLVAPIIIGDPSGPEMYIEMAYSTDKPVAFTSTILPMSLLDAGVPAYTDPRRAAHALAVNAEFSLRTVRKERAAPLKRDEKRIGAARAILSAPRPGGVLMESEAKQVLALYGAPITREAFVRSADAAVTEAGKIGGKVALKAMSYTLAHKSDAGGVRLNLATAEDIKQAYAGIHADVAKKAPDAKIEGVLVQEMAPARLEMLAGMKRDPALGPIVAIGLGGILVEALNEAALLQAPFDKADVEKALGGLLGGRLLQGKRGLSREEIDALAQLAVALGAIALELPEIAEIDVNPVCVANGKVLAADALIVVGDAS